LSLGEAIAEKNPSLLSVTPTTELKAKKTPTINPTAE